MRIYKSIPLILTSILLSQISFPRIEQVQFEQLDSLQETEKDQLQFSFILHGANTSAL